MTDKLRAHRLRWSSPKRMRSARIPAKLKSWLVCPSSLTSRLKRACPGSFKVRVLRQGWGQVFQDEARLLGLRAGMRAHVREVRLLCGATPWVFARTILPAPSLSGRARRLTRLGSKPLGALLFADKSVRRGDLQFALIEPGSALFARIAPNDTPPATALWGRRCLFYVNGKPLLVSEVFLTAIPHYPSCAGVA